MHDLHVAYACSSACARILIIEIIYVNVCCQGVIGQITRICRRHFKFFDGFKVFTLNRDLR